LIWSSVKIERCFGFWPTTLICAGVAADLVPLKIQIKVFIERSRIIKLKIFIFSLPDDVPGLKKALGAA